MSFQEVPHPLNPYHPVKTSEWNGFTIAYDSPKPFSLSKGLQLGLNTVLNIWESAPYIRRMIVDVWTIAPMAFTCYLLGSCWASVSPAICLYLASMTLGIIQSCAFTDERLIEVDYIQLQYCLLAWMLIEASQAATESFLTQVTFRLGGRLKSHFLPKLARASLSLDVRYSRDDLFFVHHKWFSADANPPALDFIREVTSSIGYIFALAMQLLVLLEIIYTSSGMDAQITAFLLMAFFTMLFLTPPNAIGGAGYTFWTDNTSYHRWSNLHSIIFNTKYRNALVKDSAAQYIKKEYSKNSSALRDVNISTWDLATRFPAAWYWLVAKNIVMDYPLALHAFILSVGLSQSSLASMTFFQYAITKLRHTLSMWNPNSFLEAIRGPQNFYTALANDSAFEQGEQGTELYPNQTSHMSGMKLSFQNVSVAYGDASDAVKESSFEINPGQFILIVGVNGSGKSSLLKLIPRLLEPTSGKIFIDDKPIKDYDAQSLRKSIAFLAQKEVTYPLSVRENILMGSPEARKADLNVYAAARYGGCGELLKEKGDAIIDPPGVVGQSCRFNGNGSIGPGAADALHRHFFRMKSIDLSEGEKQRVTAARTFFKILSDDFRLLVVDEPTSSMDAIAECDLFERFLTERRGMTTIFVSHRFRKFVNRADLILCMDEGKIVQQGSHAELINQKDKLYARLCAAQGVQ